LHLSLRSRLVSSSGPEAWLHEEEDLRGDRKDKSVNKVLASSEKTKLNSEMAPETFEFEAFNTDGASEDVCKPLETVVAPGLRPPRLGEDTDIMLSGFEADIGLADS
jgi:hypothetical protein